MSEQRKWLRFPVEKLQVVFWPNTDREFAAKVVNESFGGMAVELPAPDQIKMGEPTPILYNGAAMQAILRWSRKSPEGNVLAGWEWVRYAAPTQTGSLTSMTA